MIIEDERNGCIDSIINSLTKTSAFRTRKASQYPDDPRNAKAAGALTGLANDAAEHVDGAWTMLQHYYQPDSKAWRDALCLATKDVGFSNKSRSFPYFLTRLVSLLAQLQNVAA
jgi:hypothetical protein